MAQRLRTLAALTQDLGSWVQFPAPIWSLITATLGEQMPSYSLCMYMVYTQVDTHLQLKAFTCIHRAGERWVQACATAHTWRSEAHLHKMTLLPNETGMELGSWGLTSSNTEPFPRLHLKVLGLYLLYV